MSWLKDLFRPQPQHPEVVRALERAKQARLQLRTEKDPEQRRLLRLLAKKPDYVIISGAGSLIDTYGMSSEEIARAEEALKRICERLTHQIDGSDPAD